MVPNYHPTWEIYDSSKLSTYQTCARLYFFEYILGWRREGPAHDLYFGNAWHEAREYQLLNGYDDVEGAYQAFLDFYRQEFPPASDVLFTPKDPQAVRIALEKFRDERQSDLEKNEVLFTETSGTVPITDTITLHYRLDSILREKESGKIFSWDHKSAKNFGRTWADKFFLGMQTGTYTHCLYCMYPIDSVKGIEFCGTAFKYFKRGGSVNPKGYGIEFLRVPAWKSPDQMNVWLWNTIDLVLDLKRDMERLDDCREDDKVLHAFRMNTESCTKYWGCPFHDYCMAWPNPLINCNEPPTGYLQEWWDPSEMNTTNKMDLQPYNELP